MWAEVSVILLAIIILLLAWIYFSGGGTPRTLKLKKEINSLQEKVEDLRETNKVLRSGMESSEEEYQHPVVRASALVENLERLKDALKGSKTAKDALREKFGEEPNPDLVDRILSSEPNISSPLKRRLAHEILVGDSGRDILRRLEEGATIENAVAEAGVPLNTGRQKVVALQRLGYLDNKLNLTEAGREALL
ncbi:hypothetical protein AKJ35_01155 [candidate division MSBL1 archaeon SCGC-AAA833F18]|uniref:Uncharacterized protein n=1 Tax=candidate division MSBL1 archaeon SCGC-AAA833F18 TaxID=1698257 RepID=A0A133VS42_9EURY|nr:hypothetical protein AKJ35_01155 [candidate division MSBL1 archaeon SCGC-AAA833F18]